jgi:hypothetical protein
LHPSATQQAAQHPRTGEGKLQMQTVEPPHDRKVGLRHWPRLDAAAADAQNLSLLADRQAVPAVDHRFALSNPAW